MKTRLRLLAFTCLAIVCVIALLWLTAPDYIRDSSVYEIDEGMSEEQVLAVLGVPGTSEIHYSDKKLIAGVEKLADPTVELTWKEWRTDKGVVLALAFAHGRLVQGVTSDRQPSWVERLRRWLGLGPSG